MNKNKSELKCFEENEKIMFMQRIEMLKGEKMAKLGDVILEYKVSGDLVFRNKMPKLLENLHKDYKNIMNEKMESLYKMYEYEEFLE